MTLQTYDALLIVSFGGPEGPDDVLPFLENVTRGRGIPPARLLEVAEHYLAFGGVSPINEQCRALKAAVEADLASAGVDVRVYWGNRNWHPLLPDTVGQMGRDGVRRAAAFVTSAYSSYSGCRQYREDLAAAVAAVGAGAPRIDKLRHYYNHPGFVEPMVDSTLAALAELPIDEQHVARLAFVTHSIPVAAAATSGPRGDAYVSQHRRVSSLVADGVATRTGVARPWELVYCSRSGPPSQPWLEPDVNDALRGWHDAGERAAVLVPIGFVSDHMEVRFDLDTEAMATAKDLGMAVTRAATVGTDPRFVALVRDLLLERDAAEAGARVTRRALGEPSHDVCPAGCCPNPRGPRPALAGVDS